jgi:ribulose 1,5-bisphosphate synthetase/thiazole synthase
VKQISCDVLVVGGGVAGASAAIAAARSGVDTVLLEKEPYLGGTGYAGMFQSICGLYLNAETVPTETLNPGITREIEERLRLAAPGNGVKKMGQVYVLSCSHIDLQAAITALVSAEKQLTVLFRTNAAAVNADQGKVRSVTTDGEAERMTIYPKTVIDCTGDGAIASVAGAEYEIAPPDKRQLSGFTVFLKGIKNADDSLSLQVPYHCARAVQQGMLPASLRFTLFSPGKTADEGYCKMSVESSDQDQLNDAKKNAELLIRYLVSAIPAFQNASIGGLSPKVLEREGRRIRGAYLLTEEDVLGCRKFPDGIVKNAWPIELWDRTRGTLYNYIPRGDYYEIPFRCLTVNGFSNLLTAGRCISVTAKALGSTRVMGTCMTLGDRAGQAAAYFSRYGKYPAQMKEC